MADGSAITAGGHPRRGRTAPVGARCKRIARRRSTLAFLMTLPLLLIIGGLVVYPFFYAL